MTEQGKHYAFEAYAEAISTDIANRNYVGRLPSIAVLAKNLGTSKITVRDSLLLLQERGIVRLRQGSGTYIVEAPEPPALSPKEVMMGALPDLFDLRNYLVLQSRLADRSFSESPTTEQFEDVVKKQMRIRTYRSLSQPIFNNLTNVPNDELLAGREHLLVPIIRREFSSDFEKIVSFKKEHPDSPINPAALTTLPTS